MWAPLFPSLHLNFVVVLCLQKSEQRSEILFSNILSILFPMVTVFFSDNFPDFYFRCFYCCVFSNCLILLVPHEWVFGNAANGCQTMDSTKKSTFESMVLFKDKVVCKMMDERYQISNTATMLQKTETRWSIKKWFKDHAVFSIR